METEVKFMIIRKADAETEAGVLPSTELIEAMTAYNEEMVKAGVMLMGEGLAPSREAVRVKFHGGKPNVIDGPFAEARELVGGFSIIEVPSLAEAIAWVRKWPQIDGHGEVEIEIFRVLTAEDFGEAFTPELQQKEEMLRQQAARQQ
jgi:hypothetical protein